jgi:DNA invertase Pin-like site-specific DNA recombinase
LKAKGIDLYLHRQGLDTSTPTGKMMFQMLGVFSEFERAMIVGRVKAGMRRARAQGKGGWSGLKSRRASARSWRAARASTRWRGWWA